VFFFRRPRGRNSGHENGPGRVLGIGETPPTTETMRARLDWNVLTHVTKRANLDSIFGRDGATGGLLPSFGGKGGAGEARATRDRNKNYAKSSKGFVFLGRDGK